MPNYKYRVIYEDGKIGRGRVMGLNKAHVIDTLKKDNTQPIMIKKIQEHKKKYKRLDYKKMSKQQKINRLSINDAGKEKEKRKSFKDLTKMDVNFNLFRRVTTKDLMIFSNNLYILKKARFNNVEALQTIYDGTENPAFKDIIEDILIGVESGQRLYAIMENYPKAFPPMYVNFIRVGEESGTLDTALLYARDFIENSISLRKKIRGAIIPRILQVILILGMTFAGLLIGVPILEEVYTAFDSSQEIPAATMFGLKIAKWVMANWYIIIGIIIAMVTTFMLYINTPKGRFNWDKLILKIPVLGDLMNNIIISKFFQAMLLNLKNGMRIQESLEISKNVVTNYYFSAAIEVGKSRSLTGSSWIEPFQQENLFKPMVAEMIGIGMKTDLTEMMEKVNEYIMTEIDESLARFVKVLPEISYMFVGIVLIAFVIMVLVPIINVYMGGFIEMPG